MASSSDGDFHPEAPLANHLTVAHPNRTVAPFLRWGWERGIVDVVGVGVCGDIWGPEPRSTSIWRALALILLTNSRRFSKWVQRVTPLSTSERSAGSLARFVNGKVAAALRRGQR